MPEEYYYTEIHVAVKAGSREEAQEIFSRLMKAPEVAGWRRVNLMNWHRVTPEFLAAKHSFPVKLETREPEEYAERFTLDEFQGLHESGCILPYDGHGYYGTETGEFPVEVFDGVPPIDTTHVWWYNK